MNLTDLSQSQWLKEHGAPQDTVEHIWSITRTTDWHISNVIPGDKSFYPDDWYAAYDLESLIRWLGNSFNHLERLTDGWEAEQWATKISIVPQSGYGNTPLEAVYALVQKIHTNPPL